MGRGQGVVTSPDDLEPWINLSARVPIGNAEYRTIYLACYAVIGGLKSAPTNRFLTISWYPGGFSAEEFPPPGPASTSAEDDVLLDGTSPDWVRDSQSPLQGSAFSSALGRPVEGYRTSSNPREELLRRKFLAGAITMRPGEVHTFVMQEPANEVVYGETLEPIPDFRGKYTGIGRDMVTLASPPSVLSAHGTTVRAVGEGAGEVLLTRLLQTEYPDGSRDFIRQIEYHLVLVGEGALAAYQGRKSSVLPGPPGPPLAQVVLYGRAVRSGSLQPVPGAKVTLVNMKTGKEYTRDDWTTGSDGTFTIAAHPLLPAGRYEVLPQRFSGGGLGPERDLWTVRQYQIEIKEG